jgi:Ca2+-transporting ATPase
MLQLVNAFNCRSVVLSAWHNLWGNRWLLLAAAASLGLHLMIIYVPELQAMFNTKPLGAMDWALIGGAGVLMLAKAELGKRFGARTAGE